MDQPHLALQNEILQNGTLNFIHQVYQSSLCLETFSYSKKEIGSWLEERQNGSELYDNPLQIVALLLMICHDLRIFYTSDLNFGCENIQI